MKRLFQRICHLMERVIRESRRYSKTRKNFGKKVAKATFIDGIIPPGKSDQYIATIEEYIDDDMGEFVKNYKFCDLGSEKYPDKDKIPIWVCWWQGYDSMPELVKMCYNRLRNVIPINAELNLITMDNYSNYISFPKFILEKYEKKIITMTNLSDMLRMELLSKYGGAWVDATVFFTDFIPEEFFNHIFFSQKMYPVKREACRGLWCGFCMAGYSYNPLFHFTRDAFYEWWKKHDDIVDYVLIDYLNLLGYKNFAEIKDIVDTVPNNNEDVFMMYQVLHQPYTEELYQRLTRSNYIHKLTYKIDLIKETKDGQETLYGHLLNEVMDAETNEMHCE